MPAEPAAADERIDTSGTLCPIPIVETAKIMKRMDAGKVLLVIATDPGIAMDMPMWCKATKNEHLGTFKDGAVWKSWVRKKKAK
jgi:TusA-related sulfurtransferase